MIQRMKPLKDRFEEKIIRLPMTDCHLWDGAQTKDGYGKISINHKPQLAHRISYKLYNGDIPDGMHILHSCDIPYCVNPNHLRIGTHAENMRDKSFRGKFIVSNETVRSIRKDLGLGISVVELSRRYSLPYHYVHMIKRNKARKFV